MEEKSKKAPGAKQPDALPIMGTGAPPKAKFSAVTGSEATIIDVNLLRSEAYKHLDTIGELAAVAIRASALLLDPDNDLASLYQEIINDVRRDNHTPANDLMFAYIEEAKRLDTEIRDIAEDLLSGVGSLQSKSEDLRNDIIRAGILAEKMATDLAKSKRDEEVAKTSETATSI